MLCLAMSAPPWVDGRVGLTNWKVATYARSTPWLRRIGRRPLSRSSYVERKRESERYRPRPPSFPAGTSPQRSDTINTSLCLRMTRSASTSRIVRGSCGRARRAPWTHNWRVPRSIVALVGRPNTGKSTLFNRLIGWRKAIVDRQPGLTRDRLYGVAEWRGREFTVVDTAGLDLNPEDASRAAVERQTRVAIDEAHVIVFLLDAREGVTPIDRDIAEMLRRSGRPVVVAANKVDDPRQTYLRHEVLELGFADPVVMSGHHGIGVDDLLNAVVARLPLPDEEVEPGEEAAARLAIMGRPNVGKSSLLNQL